MELYPRRVVLKWKSERVGQIMEFHEIGKLSESVKALMTARQVILAP
jgi:hypothetical protein